jgi:hypothetical protein
MSTKNNPGQYDCHANADPDEEMFILLGRDRHASALVGLWALMREKEGEDSAAVAEARECAERLAAEAQRRGKPVLTLDALLAMAASLQEQQHPLPVEPAADGRPVNDAPVEGDIVVAGRGMPGRLVKVFTKDDSDKVHGRANIVFPRAQAPTTVSYDQLRRALPEEAKAYREAGGS